MSDIKQRKRDHIKIVMENDVEPTESPFDYYQLPYSALPEINLEDIDVSSKFFDWNISFPFIVASMTGGEKHGRTINENVAKACEAVGIPFGLGSMRVIIKHPESVETFNVKEFAPSVPMFANVGLVQLNYGFTEKEFLKIIEAVQADGLFIHINHLQEAVQPEGDTNFKDLLPKLKQVLKHIEVPVIAKEVGHGIDENTALQLQEVGIEMIDIAGTGGSSWSWIEGYRQPEYDPATNLGYLTRSLGVPTDQAITDIRNNEKLKAQQLIASGGVRNGLHIAIALSLGANYASAANPLLAAAMESAEAVQLVLERYKRELIVSMFSAGAKNLKQLRKLGEQ